MQSIPPRIVQFETDFVGLHLGGKQMEANRVAR